MNLVHLIAPELLLVAIACILFLLGVSNRAASRRLSAFIAFATLVAVCLWQLVRATSGDGAATPPADEWNTVVVGGFATYVKMMVAGVGAVLTLLAWPTNREATGSASLDFGRDAGEFYALMLLSLAGVMLVAGANDLILLFLGIELASIPTYIMVSISRPLPVAQEAGVKYFFLGAMSAAVMLFGFSYLYGTTGTTDMSAIAEQLRATIPGGPAAAVTGHAQAVLSSWQTLAVVMLIAGFAFKIAAVPLHFYAGDVYQGAATPVTAFLSFVPKCSGMIALLKLVYVAGGNSWAAPETMTRLLWILALLTMTVGNTVALWQPNVKRLLAYSSIAHTGYMLVGVTALASATQVTTQDKALQGVLFYLAAYGIMNAGAF